MDKKRYNKFFEAVFNKPTIDFSLSSKDSIKIIFDDKMSEEFTLNDFHSLVKRNFYKKNFYEVNLDSNSKEMLRVELYILGYKQHFTKYNKSSIDSFVEAYEWIETLMSGKEDKFSISGNGKLAGKFGGQRALFSQANGWANQSETDIRHILYSILKSFSESEIDDLLKRVEVGRLSLENEHRLPIMVEPFGEKMYYADTYKKKILDFFNKGYIIDVFGEILSDKDFAYSEENELFTGKDKVINLEDISKLTGYLGKGVIDFNPQNKKIFSSILSEDIQFFTILDDCSYFESEESFVAMRTDDLIKRIVSLIEKKNYLTKEESRAKDFRLKMTHNETGKEIVTFFCNSKIQMCVRAYVKAYDMTL